jgi:hypothetical protein
VPIVFGLSSFENGFHGRLINMRDFCILVGAVFVLFRPREDKEGNQEAADILGGRLALKARWVYMTGVRDRSPLHSSYEGIG